FQKEKSQHASKCDVMENAEIDELIRRHQQGGHGDGNGRSKDKCEPADIGLGAEVVAIGKVQAEADDEEERYGDATGKGAPSAGDGGSWVDIAEKVQVPHEVVDRHGDQGQTTRDINQLDPAAHGGANMHVHERRLKYCYVLGLYSCNKVPASPAVRHIYVNRKTWDTRRRFAGISRICIEDQERTFSC